MGPEIYLSLPAGMMIASVASVVGIGGGILWMPFLIIVLNLAPEKAILTSLLIQTFGMGSGSFGFIRKKRSDLKLSTFLLGITIPGVAVGALIAKVMRPAHLEMILGVLTMVTALLFVSANQKYDEAGASKVDMKKAVKYSWFLSLISIASGMLSISIGEWLVPIMRSKMALKMSTAVATSITTIFGLCVAGSMFHLILGAKADWRVVLWAAPGVLMGGQIGPLITEKINERMLKEVFVFFLTLTGIHLIYNSY